MTILKGSALASKTVTITQGEFAVTDEPDVILATLLGSCVACCLWDETAKIGGMNHLLLATGNVREGGETVLAGIAEMECLINGIIKLGGRRSMLQAKVFGGANMGSGGVGIGSSNSDFAMEFLESEGIGCLNSDVGGNAARRVRFWPSSGRVSLRNATRSIVDESPPPAEVVQSSGNAPELF